jgi:hypothetical protein
MPTVQQHVVNDILAPTFETLKQEIADKGECCDLKSLDFSQGTPDYADPFVQKLYILKYYWAYMCEYRTLYRKLIPLLEGAAANVIAIGCGSEVDLAGLFFASNQSTASKYHGYDLVNWSIKPTFPGISRGFTEGCASQLNENANTDANIVIFPKSLGDISDSSFNRIKEALRNAGFASRRLVLASVLPSSARTCGFTIYNDRFREISQVIKATGFNVDHDMSSVHNPFDHVKYWWELYPIQLDRPALDYLSNLNEQCPTFIANGVNCEENCRTILGRSAVLKNENVKFQYARFSR